jgi:hypothetical protein
MTGVEPISQFVAIYLWPPSDNMSCAVEDFLADAFFGLFDESADFAANADDSLAHRQMWRIHDKFTAAATFSASVASCRQLALLHEKLRKKAAVA